MLVQWIPSQVHARPSVALEHRHHALDGVQAAVVQPHGTIKLSAGHRARVLRGNGVNDLAADLGEEGKAGEHVP